MKSIFEILSIVFAIFAAFLWIISACVSAPKGSGYISFDDTSRFNFLHSKYKPTQHGAIDNDKFYSAMSCLLSSYKTQSNLSGLAAICAAIAAICQAISFAIDNTATCKF